MELKKVYAVQRIVNYEITETMPHVFTNLESAMAEVEGLNGWLPDGYTGAMWIVSEFTVHED